MSDSEVLRRIVVEVSRDGETGSGTGFYISRDEIATCYHVLVPEGGELEENYWIRHDDDKGGWLKATLLRHRPLPDDIAILKTTRKLASFDPKLIRPWNKERSEFISQGYSEEMSNTGLCATQIDGQIIKIMRIYKEKSLRLQLQTKPDAIKGGRSGSPVFSSAQKAVVGMIDYQGGALHRDAQIGAAIPIEAIVPEFEEQEEYGILIGIPNLPPNFIPRPIDLQRAKEAVLACTGSNAAITGAYRSVGLQGMGGIGKSVLATALARDKQVRSAFKDGIIWIGLGQQADLLQSQIKLIDAIDPDHGPIADTEKGRDELEKVLHLKCCLIILDDVWTMEQLWAFDRLGPDCRLLITTRNRELVRNSGATECRLDVLTDGESLELLRLWSGKQSLPPQALEVARECDNLPLALAMVGAMVRGKPDDRWDNLLHRLISADLEKIKGEFKDYSYPNLMRAIEISTDNLEAEQKRLYLDLAVFPEDEQVPEGALQVLWNMDRYDAEDLIDLFVDRSLATLKDGRLGVHDLQHDFMTKRSLDLPGLHERLLTGYYEKCGRVWARGPNDGYFFQHLVYHLCRADRQEELKTLLLDYDWMQARLQATDVPSLLSDYDPLNTQQDLRLIQGAIRLSAHVLFRDPGQLPGQLTGRLMGMQEPSIQSLIKKVHSTVSHPWLRPLTGSLTPPGGPLIRTLQGHTYGVSAVAVSPDGRRAISGSGDNTLKVWDLETGREVMTLEGHTGRISAVAVSPDGRRAISGSGDNTLKVWDLETGKLLAEFSADGPITAFALSRDKWIIVAGDISGRVHILSLENPDA